MPPPSSHRAKQLRLKNVFALLILLGVFVGLIILPTHRFFTLSTMDIPDHMSSSRHVSLARLAFGDVHDGIKEVGFAMLASKVPTDNIVVVRKMSLTVLATVDTVRVEVDIVC